MVKTRKRPAQGEPFAAVVRRAIRQSGKTHYRIAKDGGITPDQIDRFVDGSRDVRLTTLEKIVSGIGYRLALEALE